ncbi:MAG: ornithine carbamoyltransferase [Candidatus Aenigmarchaeota archaeon]|nr:ornithine carbamoyltransferase [Candidatus Aenigmarchaeota archaeon]
MAHFLSISDLSGEYLLKVLDKSKDLKKKTTPDLKNKTLLLIFEKPSTRTRISFTQAMYQLGGNVIALNAGETQLGRGETVADTARAISRYVDVVAARVYSHQSLVEMSQHSSIPVINALSDMEHPCQIMADLLTIKEKFKRLEGLKLAYIGDGNNVCNSLLLGCSALRISISVASPKGYEPDNRILQLARNISRPPYAVVDLMQDPSQAVKDADIVYTDTWVSMGDEKEKEKRLKAFRPYQVNDKLLSLAKPGCIFMHDLPAYRGNEVTDSVMDGPRSVVWDQAENRLHTEKAILLYALGKL